MEVPNLELPKNVTIKRKSAPEQPVVFERASPSLAPPFYVVTETKGSIQPLRTATMIPLADVDTITIQEVMP